MSNTDAADINEIQLGWYLSDNWAKFKSSTEAKKQLKTKLAKVGQAVYDDQTAKAEAMSKEILKWSRSNGYTGIIEKVWWTARPGVLAEAVGRPVDSRKNPTDILVKFRGGEFLGLSAKSTKRMSDIGFKNPGAGTIQKRLGLSFKECVNAGIEELLRNNKSLPEKTKDRKEIMMRGQLSFAIVDSIDHYSKKVLNEIREKLYTKLSKMNQEDLLSFVLDDWMDANETYPRYVKITGMRVGAKVEDPLSNSRMTYLATNDIVLSREGNDAVGISAGQHRIMKMRAKWESQKLASSLKFSGDPWK
jgi:hypothetical protein